MSGRRSVRTGGPPLGLREFRSRRAPSTGSTCRRRARPSCVESQDELQWSVQRWNSACACVLPSVRVCSRNLVSGTIVPTSAPPLMCLNTPVVDSGMRSVGVDEWRVNGCVCEQAQHGGNPNDLRCWLHCSMMGLRQDTKMLHARIAQGPERRPLTTLSEHATL